MRWCWCTVVCSRNKSPNSSALPFILIPPTWSLIVPSFTCGSLGTWKIIKIWPWMTSNDLCTFYLTSQFDIECLTFEIFMIHFINCFSSIIFFIEFKKCIRSWKKVKGSSGQSHFFSKRKIVRIGRLWVNDSGIRTKSPLEHAPHYKSLNPLILNYWCDAVFLVIDFRTAVIRVKRIRL